jgi:purine-cytosine permease-like protein
MIHPPRPPSIDQGVAAFIWALVLAVFVFFGLAAIGASSATSIVLALVAFAAIWLVVRLRGEDVPPRR